MNAARHSPRSNIRNLLSSFQIQTPNQSTTPNQSNKRQAASKKSKKQGSTKTEPPVKAAKPYKKKKITGALREAVWIKTMGRTFEGKCPVVWCPNTITAFDFQAGHNIPESKGGSTTLPNLIAICARCNFSMGNQYTIDEWNAMHAPGTTVIPPPPPASSPQPKRTFFQKIFCCFFSRPNHRWV
jgi:5-methylcytosine-specific restriction endonuclease McrA